MSSFGKAMLILCGLLLLLPGLCTFVFGGIFALSMFSGQNDYGLSFLSIPWLLVGGLLIWGAVAIFRAVVRASKPDHTDSASR